jgi:hypothetical protein
VLARAPQAPSLPGGISNAGTSAMLPTSSLVTMTWMLLQAKHQHDRMATMHANAYVQCWQFAETITSHVNG